VLRAEEFNGDIVLVGEEAREPYERPALSKGFLSGERSDLQLRPGAFWRDRAIELRLGTRVHHIDIRRRLARTPGGAIRWDALVLATGARSRRLSFLDGRAGVHVLRTFADAEALRSELRPGRRLAIVGAGFVGTEVASTALGLGLEVSLLEAGETPFEATLGSEVGSALADRYRAAGVDMRVGARVAKVMTTGGRPRALVLACGDEIACDVVLVAVGTDPATELFCRGPIEIDACGQTRLPGVYACGDAATAWRPGIHCYLRTEHWSSAAAQGAAVARRIMGREEPADEVPYFWSDQFGLRLQHVGHGSGWASVAFEGSRDSFIARYLARDGSPVAVLFGNRPQEVAAVRRELAEVRLAA
jgi:NADPH-dependent 2,4-dienoyl-CoA reductase/sulfur reductase-like enzyme